MERPYNEIITPDRARGEGVKPEMIMANLGLRDEDLKNKTILDIGSGSAEFAGLIEKKPELAARVISLDPKYNLENLQKILEEGEIVANMETIKDTIKKIKENKLQAIAALSEDMSFLKDESMDFIASHFSVPWHCDDPQKLKKRIEESIRILKSGGEIRLYPIDESCDYFRIIKEIVGNDERLDLVIDGRNKLKLMKIKKK